MKKYIFIFLACFGVAQLFNSCTNVCKNDCLNGGNCVNGDCECSPGFTGPNCENPVGVKVTRITVSSIPFTDTGGVNWDETNGPDVYVAMKDESNLVVYNSSAQTDTDVLPSDLPINFRPSTPYGTFDLSKQLTVTVYDNDDLLDDDDVIGSVTFNIKDYIDGWDAYPLSAEKKEGSTTIRIYFEWEN